MASFEDQQKALEDLTGIKPDPSMLKEMMKNQMRCTYSGTEEELDAFVDSCIKNGGGMMLQQAKASLSQIMGLVKTFPSMVTNLQTQIASIPAACAGPAAPAGAPMIQTVMSQASALKQQAITAVSMANQCGLVLPDSFMNSINVLGKICPI